MNRSIKNGMLFFGIVTQLLVYAAEAKLEDKVARYFSNRRSTVQKNNLNPVTKKVSETEDKAARYFSFRHTTQSECSLQSATVHTHLDTSLQEQ